MSVRVRPAPLVRRFRDRNEGSILPLAGLASAALIGFAGLGVDLGAVYLEKRRVQSAADLAALAAVRSPSPGDAARRALGDNGYPVPASLTVTAGVYTADRGLTPAARFSAADPSAATTAGTPNAVRVTLGSGVRAGFSRVVGGPARYGVSGTATALRADLAAFGIGSRLASLDAGILNGLLSAMLGARVSLTLAGYQALAGLDVDAPAFLRAAAVRAGARAVTFYDALKLSLTPTDFAATLGGVAASTAGGSQAATALSGLAAALSGLSGRVPLGGLLTLGALGAQPLASGSDALPVNALSLLTAAAALANGTDQIAVDLGGGVPGLVRARATLRVGQAWQNAGFVAPGAALDTAQARALVEVWVPGPVGLASLYLPVYVELARGRAVLRRLACPWSSSSERSAVVDASTGAAFLAIGIPAAGGLDPGAARPPLSPAPVAQVGPVAITGSAALPIGSGSQALAFTDDDIRARRTRTVSASGWSGSPTAALLSSLWLDGPQPLRGTLAVALNQATGPVDALLSSLFGAFGLRVGSADVAVTGTHCGGAVLVQ